MKKVINIDKNNRETLKQHEMNAFSKINFELLNQNEILELKNQGLQNDLEIANSMIKEKDLKIEKQGIEIKSLKDKVAQFEDQLNQINEEKQLLQIKINWQNNATEDMSIKAQVFEKQVHALTEALLNYENSIENLLNEKSKMGEFSFKMIA